MVYKALFLHVQGKGPFNIELNSTCDRKDILPIGTTKASVYMWKETHFM